MDSVVNSGVRGDVRRIVAVQTAVDTLAWETGHTVTLSPHHPLGAKAVGESATVGRRQRSRMRWWTRWPTRG